jgi:phenylalanine-4-hydroxylase
MQIYDNEVVTPVYTEEDHETWSKLCTRQMQLVEGVACKTFWEGFPKLQLDFNRLPDPKIISARLKKMTGWTLGDAQNEYLGPKEWFDHLYERRFPVTNYIRKPHELDFTPLPDLFHEYFGHLAFFTNQFFADVAQRYGEVSQYVRSDEQLLAISRLWWFTTEFGLVKEDGKLRVLGAGLLSSPGELQHALKERTPKYPFDVDRVAATPSAAYSFHDQYFVLDSMEQLREIIDQYARQQELGPA